MKHFALITLLILTFACNKKNQVLNEKRKEVLDSFGQAKIGMSISDFNAVFYSEKSNIKRLNEKQPNAEFVLDNLRINDTITLEKTHIDFFDGKLVYVGCAYSKDFFDFLKLKYGIESKSKDSISNKLTYAGFRTNSNHTGCCFAEELEGHPVIGLWKIGWYHY